MSTLAAELTDLARGDVSDENTELLDLADVVVAAATRARSRMPDIEVALDVTSVWVSGRPAALQRAVLNLIDNSEVVPAGKPVQFRLRAEGASAVLEVDDAGPGIDAADVPRVFDRFYRADSARALPGSGLGLSIVQRVVDAHGGRATVARSRTRWCAAPDRPSGPMKRSGTGLGPRPGSRPCRHAHRCSVGSSSSAGGPLTVRRLRRWTGQPARPPDRGRSAG